MRFFRNSYFVVPGVTVVLFITAIFLVTGCDNSTNEGMDSQDLQSGLAAPDVRSSIISVEGMTCGACAARIKGTLNDIDGVAEVEVSLAERNVRVRYAEEKVTPEHLAVAINELGYKATVPVQPVADAPHVEAPHEGMDSPDLQSGLAAPNVRSSILSVEGMSCGACAARVKGTLNDIDGVADVEVSLAERNVRVRYAEEKVTPEHLAAAINELGYKATVPVQPAAEEPHVETPTETSAGKLQIRTVTIPIDGMACEYCAQSVKERLTGIDGVKDVGIRLKEKTARVQYVEGLATPDRLVEEINAQGFKAGTPTGKGE